MTQAASGEAPKRGPFGSSPSEGYFDLVRTDIAPLLPQTASCILDVGCGAGATSAWLKTVYPDAHTVGLEGNAKLEAELRLNVDEAFILDLNAPLPDVGAPDLVLLLDVLEHLIRPERLLAQLVKVLPMAATVIVSLPNVAHLGVAARLLFRGRFDYEDAGILDRTHLRFFYLGSATALIEGAGLSIEQVAYGGLDGPRTRLLDKLSLGRMRDRLVKQYLFLARKQAPSPVHQPAA